MRIHAGARVICGWVQGNVTSIDSRMLDMFNVDHIALILTAKWKAPDVHRHWCKDEDKKCYFNFERTFAKPSSTESRTICAHAKKDRFQKCRLLIQSFWNKDNDAMSKIMRKTRDGMSKL